MTEQAKLADIMQAQKDTLVKRDDEIDGVWLTVLSGQHGFFYGPPGVAKSMIVADMARYFPDTDFFHRLMGKHTVPEELFGPVSISAMRDDRYEHNIQGYLPTSEFVFLDEIFKANGAILNTLLTAINERIFFNGTNTLELPLRTLFAASNEIPSEAELAALYDRFLFRFNVKDLQHPEDFGLLLSRKRKIANFLAAPAVATFSIDDFKGMRTEIQSIHIPDSVLGSMVDIRDTLVMEHNIHASSRRWLQTLDGIQAHAYLNGQPEATTQNLLPLTYMLWNQISEISSVEEVVWGVANPILYKVRALKDTITIIMRDMEAAITGATANELALVMAEYAGKFNIQLSDLAVLSGEIPDAQKDEFAEPLTYMEQVLNGQKLRLTHLVVGVDTDAVDVSVIPWEPEKI